MSNFPHAACPVCGQTLQETDDVVFCPECGAPYHRACYQKAGHCVYEGKHGTGFLFREEPETLKETAPQGFVICPHCRTGNPVGSSVCGNCGTPLPPDAPILYLDPSGAPSASQDKAERQGTPSGNTESASGGIPAYRRSRSEATPDTDKFRVPDENEPDWDQESEIGSPMDELRSQLDLNEKLDGFSLREWLSCIGPGGPMYIFQFKRMDASRRGLIFSLGAAFFPFLYFPYRKMWGWAVLAALGKLLCIAPDVLLMLTDAGKALQLPFSLATLRNLSQYSLYVDIALSIFWGLAAFTLYRRHCGRLIGRVRRIMGLPEQAPEDGPVIADAAEKELCVNLSRMGGVSVIGVGVVIAACVTGYLWLLPQLMGLLG